MTADLVRRAAAGFRQAYGGWPELGVLVPGRVNLIGEHVDYADGFVLPMAIDRWLLLAAARTPGDRRVRLRSAGGAGEATFDPTRGDAGDPGTPAWARLVTGALALCAQAGRVADGAVGWIESDLPQGAGLSSSAALTVGVATLAETLAGRPFAPLEKALLAQRAEHEFAGVPCGLMDPFTCVHGLQGSALLLDCRARRAAPVPLDPDLAWLLADSGQRHDLAAGAYATRRAEVESAARALEVPALRDLDPAVLARDGGALAAPLARRARHVVSEIARVAEAVLAARAGDWEAFGRLMVASHASLRDDFEVSTPELDALVEQSLALPGVLGARLTGGGFGGKVLVLARGADAGGIAAALPARYHARTGRTTAVSRVRPANGVRLSVTAPEETR